MLHVEGRVEGIIAQLLETGDAYRKDDAVWLRTTPYGDDKDRVLIRSNEQPTYFAADIAYHKDKIDRGYDHLINIWGADHHGYISRMKAAVEILSHDPDMLELIIGQLVSLFEGGEARQMSTRRGEMVTLTELTDAIGVDAARFFLVMRSQDQTLDLDLDLAREQSQENPVYYVQYAHARIASILRNLPEELDGRAGPARLDQPIFATVQERDLIKKLDEFPSIVLHAADRRAPHRIASYAQELAGEFHSFYKQCRVIGSEPAIAESRVALCQITRRVIARCLDTLGRLGAREHVTEVAMRRLPAVGGCPRPARGSVRCLNSPKSRPCAASSSPRSSAGASPRWSRSSRSCCGTRPRKQLRAALAGRAGRVGLAAGQVPADRVVGRRRPDGPPGHDRAAVGDDGVRSRSRHTPASSSRSGRAGRSRAAVARASGRGRSRRPDSRGRRRTASRVQRPAQVRASASDARAGVPARDAWDPTRSRTTGPSTIWPLDWPGAGRRSRPSCSTSAIWPVSATSTPTRSSSRPDSRRSARRGR